MASDRLFELLAEAKAKPSRAYRGLEAALGAVNSGIEGFKQGQDIKEASRKRALQQRSLEDVLGGPIDGLPDALNRAPLETVKEISPVASFIRRTPVITKPVNKQFVGTFGSSGVLFDPSTGGFSTSPLPGKTNVLGPKNAPTLPAGEVSQDADLNKLLNDAKFVRQNYRPDYVGPLDARRTAIAQMTGMGASEQASNFRSTVAGLRNKVLNLLSGAAISPAEGQRLMQQLPNENMSEVDFLARLANFEREINSTLSKRRASFQGAGYRVPDTVEQPEVDDGIDEDSAAIEWLQANPNDPRAAAVRAKLQSRGSNGF